MGAPAITGVVGREVIVGDFVGLANRHCKHCKGVGYVVTKAPDEKQPSEKPCRSRGCARDLFHQAHGNEVEIYEGKLRWKTKV